MNGKRAKQKRREEAQEIKKVGTVTIDVYSNLDVNVSNFPDNHDIAMTVMANAMLKVSCFFMAKQKDITSKILLPNKDFKVMQ